MKLFVSPTDHDWYTFLLKCRPDEVNFWRPSAAGSFQALQPGEPFLFKAKAPRSGIIGGGFFVRYVRAPVSLAWQAFGQNNGTPDIRTFLTRIRKYRGDPTSLDPDVGCVLLNEPFFFPADLWLPEPADWKRQIVRGKGYDTAAPLGAALWDSVVQRMADPRTVMGPSVDSVRSPSATDLGDLGRRYGAAYLTHSRLGQGVFRLGVLDAYQTRCAVTGERVRPTLEAAHIKPFALAGPNTVANGLSLRADIHKLFDLGYVTVDKKHRFQVSSRLRTEFQNGVDYYRYQGHDLQVLPKKLIERPAAEYLEWHNDTVFRP